MGTPEMVAVDCGLVLPCVVVMAMVVTFSGLTVMVAVPVTPWSLTVMVAVPEETPVTNPPGEVMVAVVVSEEDHPTSDPVSVF